MISQELKQFSARKKAYLKHQIQGLIYESRMETSEPAAVASRKPAQH